MCIPVNRMLIAYAGDGNFHTMMLFDPVNDDQQREAERLKNFMVHAALSMVGTCTGEHGVGTRKVKVFMCLYYHINGLVISKLKYI